MSLSPNYVMGAFGSGIGVLCREEAAEDTCDRVKGRWVKEMLVFMSGMGEDR